MDDMQELERSFKKAMAFKLSVGTVLILFAVGLFLWAWFFGGEKNQNDFIAFVAKIPLTAFMVLIVLLMVLIANWLMQFIRTRKWYDGNGAAVEMKTVQARVGTPKEMPGDANSISRQYHANAIYIAALTLAIFLLFKVG